MYNNMRSDRIPQVLDYAQAARVEAAITPYSKGANKGKKPLAERSRTYLRIEAVEDTYVVRLHSRITITYHPNGDIKLVLNGWTGSTDHEILARVLGTTIVQSHMKPWIQCNEGKWFPLRKLGVNYFTRGGLGNMQLCYINPEYPVVHYLDVKKYNKIRKMYSEFEKYAVGATKLRGNCQYTHDEIETLFKDYEPFKREYDKLIESALGMLESADSEEWYKLLMFLYRRCFHETENPVRAIKKEIGWLIKTLYRDEVFTHRELTDGRIVEITNSEYF